MAGTESGVSGFLRWVGGIVASVVTAVLIYHLTRPAPAPPSIAPTEVDGFVADSVSHQLLRNAVVTVTLGQYSTRQLTDTLGRYSIVFASPSATANMGSFQIEASGYQPYSNTVALKPGTNYAEVTLDAVAAAPAPAPSPSATTATAPTAAPQTHTPVTAAKSQMIFKTLPPDFAKAKTTYVGIPQKIAK